MAHYVGRLGLLLVFAVTGLEGAGERQPPGIARGVPYDLDFLSKPGWTQVNLRVTPPAPSTPLTTESPVLQNVLQVALATETEITAEHDNAYKLTSVTIGITGKSAEGRISKLTCTVKGLCVADVTIKGAVVKATTSEMRSQGIILTALVKSIPVQELQIDTAGMITRVKVNIP